MCSHSFKRQTYKSGACTVTALGNEQTNAACASTVSKDKHTKAVHAQSQLQETNKQMLHVQPRFQKTNIHTRCMHSYSFRRHTYYILGIYYMWHIHTMHVQPQPQTTDIHSCHSHKDGTLRQPTCCFVLAGTARPLYWPGGCGCCTNMHTPITYTYTQPNTHTLTLARTRPSAALCWQALRGPCTGQGVVAVAPTCILL